MVATEQALTTRIGLAALLAICVLFSADSLAFGSSALSTARDASAAQYGKPGSVTLTLNPANAGSGGAVAGAGDRADRDAALLDAVQGASAGDVARSRGDAPAQAVAQAPRQLDASTGERLPFTGLSVLPILLIGLTLIAWGALLRSRVGNERTASA